jgi:hypothetical protein
MCVSVFPSAAYVGHMQVFKRDAARLAGIMADIQRESRLDAPPIKVWLTCVPCREHCRR